MKSLIDFLKIWIQSLNQAVMDKKGNILNPVTILGLVFSFIIAGTVLFTSSPSTSPVGQFVANVNATVYPYSASLGNNLPIILILGIVFTFVFAILYLHKRES